MQLFIMRNYCLVLNTAYAGRISIGVGPDVVSEMLEPGHNEMRFSSAI